jgi:hypothetical protein
MLRATSRGQSVASDPRQAVTEFHAAVARPDASFVMFFCSPEYELTVVADEMRRQFQEVDVVGCTTAGEIGPSGYLEHSLSGVSFSKQDFSVAPAGLDDLSHFDTIRAHEFTQTLMQQLDQRQPYFGEENTLALLLVDGTSIREEPVARSFQQLLGRIPLVGGSAGDSQRFERAYVYFDGAFHLDAAILILISTHLPFQTFKHQHFVPTVRRAVVTAADADRRVVTEIDGLPAVEGYARLTGCSKENLDPSSFAAQPVVVMIGGTDYVRSIEKANPDGSLTFFSAIDEGVVLRAAVGVDLLPNLESLMTEIHDRVGDPQLVIAFDCILRKLEISERHLTESVSSLLRDNCVVGFNTYGEQYGGVHVNQTLTGVAIGMPDHE